MPKALPSSLPYYCSTCNIDYNSDVAFERHLSSKKHLRRATTNLSLPSFPVVFSFLLKRLDSHDSRFPEGSLFRKRQYPNFKPGKSLLHPAR